MDTLDCDATCAEVCCRHCSTVAALKAEVERLRKEEKLLTHKIITCGVAASHPDAALSRREKDYGGPWDSPQAEEVRRLRDRAEKAEADATKLTEERENALDRAETAEALNLDLRAEVERRDALIRGDGYEEMRQHATGLAQRAEKAEARLAKCVEALEALMYQCSDPTCHRCVERRRAGAAALAAVKEGGE